MGRSTPGLCEANQNAGKNIDITVLEIAINESRWHFTMSAAYVGVEVGNKHDRRFANHYTPTAATPRRL
jgi:hypothetical protein